MKKRPFENFHWPLWWVTLALVSFGLVNLYSAVSLWGEESRLNLFWNQMIWFGLGFVFLFLMMSLDYRLWNKLGGPLYGFCLFLLVAVLFLGKSVSGHKSWVAVGPFQFQPSEFAKLALVFVTAKYFSDNPLPWGYSLKTLWQPLGFAAVLFVLVILQKDLGTSLFYPLIFLAMAFTARVQKKTALVFLLLVVVGGYFGYQHLLRPYQKERIRIFLNPEADPKKSGYHLIQSKIAVGSGRIFGKGYMKGRINKLRYLPDKHTDFIFPVLAEEWGLIGSAAVLGLFGALLWMGMGIARRAREPFGAYIACGVASLFFWHFAINLGGVLGMIPLTGVPLPFLSYGGSSTLTFLMGIGLLLNVHMRRFMF